MRSVDGGGGEVSHRIVTIPNLLSFLRILGVPLFLMLILREQDGWAITLLAVSGFTDYLDGKIARTFNLESRLGQLLDPVADRLYIVSTVLGLAWRDIIPWWLVIALAARELVMAGFLLALKRIGIVGLPVHFLGKAATFNLLYAFPVLLLAQGDSTAARWALPIGWAFAWWGIVLYWIAAVLYAGQAVGLLRQDRRHHRGRALA
ncbi:MAG: CDP-alcohol phosphatidyltransferase family protein [Actinomycetales bacterium]|nr:CDP-alcohol phosphatidyltransferase family protein [Actinomycetales bacterium]HPZ50991.1 CDP-alcohol phosphatidyltransferase family protein [Propionibacteriaceae bacterium]